MKAAMKILSFLLLAVILATTLAACGEQAERGIKVTQTAAKAVQTEEYETADFSMTIPKG